MFKNQYRFRTLIILFSTPMLIQAQKQDAVYLKNGSIIQGEIVTAIDSNRIAIESNENLLVYNKSEVEAIKKESKTLESNGYSVSMSASFLIGERTSPSIRVVNGYKFKDRYYIGAGVGIEAFNRAYIPTFLEFNYSLTKTTTQPYLYALGGYSFPANNNNRTWDHFATIHKGGPLVGVGIGIKKHLSDGTAWGFRVGYRHQKYTSTFPIWPDGTQVSIDKFNRIEFGLSVFF